MANQDVWLDIEGKLKSLTSTLQSLPEEVRSMALQYINKRIVTDGNENNASSSHQSSKQDVSNVDTSLSNDEPSCSSAEPKNEVSRPKRGRPPCNGHASETPVQATRVSKRIKDKNITYAKVASETPRSAARKRSKGDTETEEQAEKPKSRIKKSKQSIEPAEMNRCTVKLELMEGESQSNMDDAGIIVIEPGICASELDGSVSEVDDALALFEDETSNVLEDLDILPRPRKRGRPSKKELKELEESGVLSQQHQDKAKKSIGRPRFSSYPSGYIPKPKSYRCPICHKMLASRQSYKEHHRRHTGEYYVCDLCGQKFSTNSGFLIHKKYHSDDPHVYKCTICHYTVRSQELLDEHYRSRHDPNRPREHTCYVCGKGFHTAVQLEKHLVSHATSKPYACDECDFTTAYQDGLAKHKYNVHETVGRKLFECELCHVQLRSKGTYVEHIGRHFNQRKKKCDICGKTFPTASQLASHRRCHLDPKMPCEICGKLLRNKHKMKIHLLVHSGQKDFACPHCSYVTYVKHNLKKHCIARHKVDYPPVEHPRMKKFQIDDATSLTDPVAQECLNKIVASCETAPSSTSPDTSVNSVDLSTRGDAVSSESEALHGIDNACKAETVAETSEAAVCSNMATSLFQVQQGGTQATVQSSVVMAAPSEMLGMPMPLISVPLVAYGVPADFATMGSGAGSSEKTFVTLATVSHPTVGDFSPKSMIVRPAFST